ncbi:hypothetical protein V496_04483 [Pseudogymnoascus sp. VKM F-4515 (FW-2607)]|nr:hypothetical protein V496_04483 [Pseudogymnoascus sp. VKM F-4515 (FW-2607)]KFY95856.1 hypothetical protein V498_03073 [Pseudogymnoascus sp. VKM F-4517 (FW-2822)]
MPSAIPLPLQPPQPTALLQPLLSAIPTGQLPQPPPPVHPHLSPILRQRVKLLAAPTQPWLPLLTYASDDTGDKLIELAHGEKFEPHPVSGEVEVDVDWEDGREVVVRYRRVDAETMWARIEIVGLGLWVRCVYCVGDAEGPVDGWRIGEVGVLSSVESEGQWFEGLEAAEQAFTTGKANGASVAGIPTVAEPVMDEGDDDDDAAYWAQYDATPAATPGPENRSPAPPNVRQTPANASSQLDGGAEDAYFAQYAAVQPALDAHDPDEAGANGEVESSLGAQHEREFASPAVLGNENGNGNGNGITEAERAGRERDAHIEQPRPRSAASSTSGRSAAVEVLEEKVEREGRHDTAVRQHIGASMKSLYRLARAAGMERGEFRALVETELAVVGVEEDSDEY